MSQIKCLDLTLGYGGHTVAEGISFELCSGDYLCIVGENGSGKTTLMKTLLGLIPPLSGKMILGEEVSRGGIGYLPQSNEIGREVPATVYEVVMSGFAARTGLLPFYTRRMRIAAEYNMKEMGIYHLRKASFGRLSGGQAQRALLARALCSAEKILLLDEPVAGLDPEATEDMYSLIDHLCRHQKMTVIMITHDLSAAEKYASKILLMGRKPVFFDSVEGYKKYRLARSEQEGGAE